MTFEQWLDEATKGLVAPAREKVAREVAGRDLASLGDPRAASERYGKRFITVGEVEGQHNGLRQMAWLQWFSVALVGFILVGDVVIWRDVPARLWTELGAGATVLAAWGALLTWMARFPSPTSRWAFLQSCVWMAISFNSFKTLLVSLVLRQPIDAVQWVLTAIIVVLVLAQLVYVAFLLRRAHNAFS